MSASSKKSLPLAAYYRSRLVAEHATRARAAEKVMDASDNIPTSNPELTNISDRHKLLSGEPSVKLVESEGYIFIYYFSLLSLTLGR